MLASLAKSYDLYLFNDFIKENLLYLYLSTAYRSFDEITSDKDTIAKLRAVFKDISRVDLWVGGLAEDHLEGSELGETFHKIIKDQFTKLRDGDRFWYQNILNTKVCKWFYLIL